MDLKSTRNHITQTLKGLVAKMKVTNGLQKFFRNNEVFYALGENLYTEAELIAMDEERQRADEQKGYDDRNAHYYDKWYRYNRSDDGAAYDRGVVRCVNEKKSAKWLKEDENFTIIEVNQ